MTISLTSYFWSVLLFEGMLLVVAYMKYTVQCLFEASLVTNFVDKSVCGNKTGGLPAGKAQTVHFTWYILSNLFSVSRETSYTHQMCLRDVEYRSVGSRG